MCSCSQDRDAKPSLLSFPKLKIRSGQKIVVEDSSSGDGKVSLETPDLLMVTAPCSPSPIYVYDWVAA